MPREFGKGRDAGATWTRQGLSDPNDRTVDVVKVWRVQNTRVHKQYSTALENMADEISCGPPLASDCKPVCNRAKLMQTPGWPERPSGCSQGGAALERAANEGFHPQNEDKARFDVNEAFLLHGLPSRCVDKVVRQGFNVAYSGTSAGQVFGDGCYFAQDIEKADQYSGDADRSFDGSSSLHKSLYPEGAAGHPGDVCYLLVCRVALGYSIRTRARFYNHEKKCYGELSIGNDRTGTLYVVRVDSRAY
jgi:hypothetical protein